jgi:hypothetical protein
MARVYDHVAHIAIIFVATRDDDRISALETRTRNASLTWPMDTCLSQIGATGKPTSDLYAWDRTEDSICHAAPLSFFSLDSLPTSFVCSVFDALADVGDLHKVLNRIARYGATSETSEHSRRTEEFSRLQADPEAPASRDIPTSKVIATTAHSPCDPKLRLV